MHINPTTTPVDNFHNKTPLKVVTARSPKAIHFAIRPHRDNAWFNGRANTSFMRALAAAKKAGLVPCMIYYSVQSVNPHPVFIHRGADCKSHEVSCLNKKNAGKEHIQ
jgi:hypothetical protein